MSTDLIEKRMQEKKIINQKVFLYTTGQSGPNIDCRDLLCGREPDIISLITAQFITWQWNAYNL